MPAAKFKNHFCCLWTGNRYQHQSIERSAATCKRDVSFKSAASPTPVAGYTLEGLTRLQLTIVLRLAGRLRLGLMVGRAERVVAWEHLRRVRIEAKGHHHRHHGRKVRVGEQRLRLRQVLLVPWGRRLHLAGCLLLRRLAALRLGGLLGVLLDLQRAQAAAHWPWAVRANTAPAEQGSQWRTRLTGT